MMGYGNFDNQFVFYRKAAMGKDLVRCSDGLSYPIGFRWGIIPDKP